MLQAVYMNIEVRYFAEREIEHANLTLSLRETTPILSVNCFIASKYTELQKVIENKKSSAYS